MKHGLLVVLCFAAPLVSARAQVDSLATDSLQVDTPPAAAAPATAVPSAADAIEAVREMEALRQAAMVSADTKTLAQIISEDATYVHANGLMQSRAQLLAMLESGEMKYVKFELEDVRYRAYGSTVIGTGVQRIDVRSGGKSLVLRSRYTAVYFLFDAGWKLVAYESTPTPRIVQK